MSAPECARLASTAFIRLACALLAVLASVLAGTPALAEGRLALVVGNSAYANTTPLANPRNDAADMAKGLRGLGFEVVEALDTSKSQFDAALRAFADKLAKADVALFFYAGHGLQVGAENFLVPVDARLATERDLEFEATKLDFVLRQLEIEREGRTTIVILDACRDNPLSRSLARSMGTRSTAIGRGLAATAAGLGTFIAYSTQPGNVALDGNGRNSPFTAALLASLGTPGRNLPATMIEVRKAVVTATDGKQVPWDHSALTGDFYFRPAAAAPEPGSISAPPAGSSADLAALEERLAKLESATRERKEPASPAGGASSAAPATQADVPPVTPKTKVEKVSPDFEDSENVAITGTLIRSFRAPSPIACREDCNREAACVAYQHGRKIPVMGTCQLFSRIDERREDQSWRSGVRRRAPAAAQGGLPEPLADRAPARIERGFAVYEGAMLAGEVIKTGAADSTQSCVTVCRNTSGCVAANYFDSERGTALACMALGSVSIAVPDVKGTSALVKHD